MKGDARSTPILFGLALVFLGLAFVFASKGWNSPRPLALIPLVDTQFVSTATIRTSYVQLVRAKADLSDFDCYVCHDKDKPPTIGFGTNLTVIVPPEHSDVVMAHGSHNRNNNCFNCHDEHNLQLLQTRDGHEVKFDSSPQLCGSCHGPTYRDWEVGVHGRTGGYWDTRAGGINRQICVDCHNPHSPRIPPRKPAPGPHPLHPVAVVVHHEEASK
jgi:hypothetical protein